MGSRSFNFAFSVSLGLHLVLLLVRLPAFGWKEPLPEPSTLEVIYEYTAKKEQLAQLRAELADTKQAKLSVPAPTGGGLGQPLIRIPDHALLTLERALPELLSRHDHIVDLTDLVQAAQGNPILLSYFSAIRQQIQQAANRETWMTDEGSGGVIYVSFVLTSRGNVRGAFIVEGRSSGSKSLRRIGLKIISAAAPFPPFPPSMKELSKAIVVPLEFLLGQ